MIKSDKKRKPRNGQKSQGTVPAFLLKTYEILEIKNQEYADIISWNKEGTAFEVKKVNDFAEKVLPKYFKHSNFASFVRQLNMYDFHKARHDNNENEFKHRLFKRGHKQLLGDIKRKTADNLPAPSPNQLVPVNKEFDFEKFKKDCNLFSNEMSGLKTRQGELEKITKVLFNQNQSIVKENKLLWNELLKSKDKYERKIEKLMYFIFSMMQYSGNPQISSFVNKKGIGPGGLADALGDFGDDSDLKNKLSNDQAISLLPDKATKDQDKQFKKMLKMFQNKEDPNIENLIDNLPDPNKMNGYNGILEDDEIPDTTNISEPKSKKKGRTKKAATYFEDEDYEEQPAKRVMRNTYMDNNEIDPSKTHNGVTIEDVPPYPMIQRQYSDPEYMAARAFNGYSSIPLPNSNLENPIQGYNNYNNYQDPYARDELLLERKPSEDLPFLNNQIYSPLNPLSPGIKYPPEDDI